MCCPDKRVGKRFGVRTSQCCSYDFEIRFYTRIFKKGINRFSITRTGNGKGNGKEYQVEIKEETLKAYYEYAVAPKLDNDAFLTAYLTDWEQYNLIEGEANLYFEGTYLGKTLLKTNSTDDTLKISLGRDKNVVVKRTKLKEFSKNKAFSSKKTQSRAFEIVVKNKKNTPLSILVEEQIPVSSDKQIEVEFEAGGAKVDKTLGRITWKLKIKPSEERKQKFSYSVKHPADWNIDLE
jgi:uncharacterized protein (TIGR02231 family)